MLPINVIVVFDGIEDVLLLNEFIICEHMMSKGVPTLWSVGTPCQRAQGIVMTQLLQGNEPLQGAPEVAKVSLRTKKAIVEGVLACEVPCGGTR